MNINTTEYDVYKEIHSLNKQLEYIEWNDPFSDMPEYLENKRYRINERIKELEKELVRLTGKKIKDSGLFYL